MQRSLDLQQDSFKLRSTFTIARGSRTEAHVLTLRLEDHHTGQIGRGECVPYAHYGETIAGVVEQIEQVRTDLEAGAHRSDLLRLLPAGAARNAIDAALWDLELKFARTDSGVQDPWPEPLRPVRSVRTLSLASPTDMGEEAHSVASRFKTLKLKLGGEPGSIDLDRVAAVSAAAPNCDLIVDANESWPNSEIEQRIEQLAAFRVVLIEQPLPAGADAALETFKHQIPVCADESFHTAEDLEHCAALYEVVNFKLDKTGGLTHALIAKEQAMALGLDVMVGCMVGSSLAMAPALLLAQGVSIVDLDGPYLLAEDRDPPIGLSEDGWLWPNPLCWG